MKDKFISKKYWKDESTPMGKVDELAKGYDDLINLSLGDPDLITNDIIIDNAFNDAKAGHTKYTDFRGDPELREEIAKFYKSEYDMDVDDKEIFIATGGCIAMYLALRAILDDDDEVIIQTPCFTPYLQQVQLASGVPVELPTYEKDNFQIDFNILEAIATERTRAIIINTPSNPTGAIVAPETLRRLAAFAKERDIIVISDDIYTSFSYDSVFEPISKLPGMRERTITINSFSKNFTMTGWRIGNIIAPEQIISTIQQINENVMFTAPSISQRAAIHALRNRELIQPPMIEEYRKRTFYAAQRINGIKNMHVMYPPHGTFYLFVNIKDTGLSSMAVSERILEQAHVLSIPGNSFGCCGEGYIRFACTQPTDKLKEAFDRIEAMPMFGRRM